MCRSKRFVQNTKDERINQLRYESNSHFYYNLFYTFGVVENNANPSRICVGWVGMEVFGYGGHRKHVYVFCRISVA